MTKRTPATERSEAVDLTFPRVMLAGGALMFGAVLWAGQLGAESHETVIEAHGISTFGNLVYDDPDFPHLNYVNPDAPKGGEFSTWFTGGWDNLNPYATQKGKPAVLSSSPYESLLTGTLDDIDGAYCYLCTTLEYPESKDWVIFNLRDDVTFSDGTPMTAEDVVFSLELFLEQGTESWRAAVGPRILSAEALDEYTVKYTFSEDAPRNGLIETPGAVPVFSKAWYEETGARLDESRLEPSPGTGPYMVGPFEVNQHITYVRNPNFWGAEHPMNVGQNNFDSIRIEYFADTTAAFEGFKAGEFTYRTENSSLSWATGYDFPAIENGWVVKRELPDGTLKPAYGLMFNMKSDKFADPRVREAISLMYNFTWTNETLQYGLFSQRESFWQNTELAATGVAEGLELDILQSVSDLIDPKLLTEEVRMPHTSGERQLDRKNLRKALALMEEAGWVSNADGQLEKDGKVFELEFLGYSPSFDRIMLPIVDNMKRLGIDAEWNRVDPAQYTERTRKFDFDMTYDGYVNSPIEGTGILQRFGSRGLGDVFNPAHYTHPAIDIIGERVANAETFEEMAAGVRAIDRIMRNDLFLVPTWYLPKHLVAYYDFYEHPEELPPYGLGETSIWWYNAEKAEALREAGALR